ncbi:phosphatidylinositol 4,5-bisphosphate-binding protein Slm1p [Monosporozyma unispora]|nr:hypothetical protein C6P44_004037 [Kazachstania unispora]
MSNHNTMTSAVSEMRSQQQANLQQLQNLQQHTRSLTSNTADYYHIQHQLQQQQLAQQQAQAQAQAQQAQAQAQQPQMQNSSNTTLQQQQQPQASINTPPLPNKNSLTSTHITTRNSLQRQRATQQQDPRSPLVVLIPTNAQPTDILAARFSAWRNVIKSLLVYLTEIASIQDEVVRQQLRLAHSIQFPFFAIENQSQPSSSDDKAINKFFLPLGNGSIQDVPTILNQYHGTLASVASKASKELTNEVIPRLEELRRDLLVKIKEIKSLQSDFKNTCAKELQQTKQDMKQYMDSLKEAKYNTPKQDPFLNKLILDKQIKKQIMEENYLHEAFDNLQNSGAELEKVVVMEIQNAMTIYARLLGQESQLVFDILISKLDLGFFNKDPQFEWDNFTSRDPNFVSPNLPMRKYKEIVYKYQFDPMTYEIKSGFLERRSKFLKSYSKGFYVLSPNFLHEFKTGDRKRDLVPVMSLSLNECSVAEHSKKDSTEHKFILHAKQNGIIHRGHNWVFKCDSYDSMISWYHNIKKFTSFSSNQEKTKYIIDKYHLGKDGKPKNPTNSSTNKLTKTASNQTSISTTIGNNSRAHTQDLRNSNISINRSSILNDENMSTSTPRLDNTTHTNTTSSIPDTNNSQIQNVIPSFYVETVDQNQTQTQTQK